MAGDDDLDAQFDAAMAAMAEEGLPEDTPPGDLSHDALALAIGAAWADSARYVDQWGHWFFWDGARWARDLKRNAWTLTREYIRLRAIGLDPKTATKLRSAETIAAVVNLARSNRELAALASEWDRDPYLLGTPGGTVDLRTGELRGPEPGDHITKLTAVAPAVPGTPAPLWTAFLERIFRHDPKLTPFVQRALGYALTGETKEHVLFFACGQGGNGKGVLFNTASRILGPGTEAYAAIAPQDLLLVTQSDRHPCELAMLRGARLVTAQELAPGRAWDEPKLKSLTGGDPITARFMRQDFFSFEPQFTLFVAGNHKPSFKGVDEAIRRRVLLLPFLQNIPPAERDPELPEKLKAEWPAILRWMIEGCLAWQREGLNPPASVRAATDDYLNAEDLLGQWLEERCIVSPKVGWTSLASLYGSWKAWSEARGQQPGTSIGLSKRLDERGFRRDKRKTGAGFWGLALVGGDAGDENDDSPHNKRSDASDARAHAYAPYGDDRHYRHQAPAGGEPDDDEGALI
jgi:putative DNA primase/helicase